MAVGEPLAEGTWKGRLWAFYFLWTFFGYACTKMAWNDPSDHRLVSILAVVVAWVLWLWGTVKLIKVVRYLWRDR